MNQSSTIELYAGGPGSGCNPAAGTCGRKSGDRSWTSSDAKSLIDKLDTPDLKVIGSVSTKGFSSNDLDLMSPDSTSRESIKPRLEKLGFEWQSKSVLSPKEAKQYKGSKTFTQGKWSEIDHYTHKDTGQKIDVWSIDKE